MDILGTNVAAAVVPFSTEDQFPTHFAKYGNGGWRSVLTLEDLDEIPSARREDGMAVYVVEEKCLYIYLDGEFEKFSGGSEAIEGRVAALETKAVGWDAHLTDEDNPHGVTASQVGALALAGGSMDDGARVEIAKTTSSKKTKTVLAGTGVEINGGTLIVKPEDGVVGGISTVYANRSIDTKSSGRKVGSLVIQPDKTGTIATIEEIPKADGSTLDVDYLNKLYVKEVAQSKVTGLTEKLTEIEGEIVGITSGEAVFDSILMKSGDKVFKVKIVSTSGGGHTIAIEEATPVGS